ncbi:MAG: LysE family translocator [Planctomycetota bacterium]
MTLLLPLAEVGPSLAAGMLLGIGAAAPPGPVNIEIARRIPKGGWLAGAAVGLGAVTVDVVLALAMLAGVLSAIDAVPVLRTVVAVVGACLLLWLGYGAIRSGIVGLRGRSKSTDETTIAKASPATGYATGLLLCSTSPYQAAFWLTGVPAVLRSDASEGRLDEPVAVVAGVFVATLAWVVTWSTLVTLASAGNRQRGVGIATDLIGGAVLLSFGVLVVVSLL